MDSHGTSRVDITMLVIALIFSAIFLLRRKWRRTYNLPPGPWGWPVLGHLPFLANEPYKVLHEYGKKYGNIFRINFGMKSAVILGNFSTIEEAFKLDAMGRADEITELTNISHGTRSVLDLQNKESLYRRSVIFSALRDSNRVQSNEETITKEIGHLLEALQKRDLTADLNVRKDIQLCTNNIITQLLYSRRCKQTDPDVERLKLFCLQSLECTHLRTLAYGLHIPPFLQKYIFPRLKKAENVIREMDNALRTEIENHKKTLNVDQPRDFIDMALVQTKKTEPHHLSTEGFIRGDIQLMVIAGAEAPRATIEWLLILLAKYPDMQDRIRQEIRDSIGDTPPLWQDHLRLPYTEAFIMESQRFFTLEPLTMIRKASSDTTVGGYDIPAGTWVIGNLWSVNRDPTLWNNHQEFDPTRFLTENGTKVAAPKFWIPFSIGSRTCMGEKLSKMTIFMMFVSIIQNYHVLPPSAGVSLEDDFVIALQAKHPIVRLVQDRPATP